VKIVSYVILPTATQCEQIIVVHKVNATGMGISEHVHSEKKGNKHFTSNLIKHAACIVNCFSPAYNSAQMEFCSQLHGIYVAQPQDVRN
jgi:hypothetical protein